MESAADHCKKISLSEQFGEIDIKDTIIPEHLADSIPKEDYPYYYMDKNVRMPEIAKKFTPNMEAIFFNYGHKKQERMIFPESEGYTDDEEEKYQKFEEYLTKNKYFLPETLTKRRKMRFLYGNNFNHKSTYKNILATLEFRHQNLPFLVNDEIKQLVDSGMMYIHGRDKCFRPIFIVQSAKITESTAQLDNILKAAYFVTFYGMENMCLPGKIENWISINDMGGLSIRKLPTKFIGKLLKSFQTHLKCRGRKFIMLNVTFGIRAIWKILSPFVDANTHLRTDVTKDSTHLYLQHMVHPSQLEERFGGEAPNLTQYWPPKYVSDEFGHDPKFISDSKIIDGKNVDFEDKITKLEQQLKESGTNFEDEIDGDLDVDAVAA